MYIGTPAAADNEDAAVVVRHYSDELVPCSSISRQLICIAAYLNELRTQSHLIHLNYEGENFLPIHQFFKDQYEAHQEQFDAVGEYVRSMDFWMPMCSDGLKEALPCFHHVKSHSSREMLTVYYQNLDDLVTLIEEAEPVATELRALDVANYMAELMGAINKAAWFIKATLRTCA